MCFVAVVAVVECGCGESHTQTRLFAFVLLFVCLLFFVSALFYCFACLWPDCTFFCLFFVCLFYVCWYVSVPCSRVFVRIVQVSCSFRVVFVVLALASCSCRACVVLVTVSYKSRARARVARARFVLTLVSHVGVVLALVLVSGSCRAGVVLALVLISCCVVQVLCSRSCSCRIRVVRVF